MNMLTFSQQLISDIVRAVLFLFLLISCNEAVHKHSTVPLQVQDEIVLIFDKLDVNNRYRLENGSSLSNNGLHELSYIDDNLVTQYLAPKYAPHRDTLIIITKREYVEVQHAYKAIDKLSYLFYKGDTVLFTYTENMPAAKVLNRVVADSELNYEILKRQQWFTEDFPAVVKARNPFYFYAFNIKEGVANEAKRVHKEAFEEAVYEFIRESKWIDSLRNQKSISTRGEQFFRLKSILELKKSELQTPNLYLIQEPLQQALVSSIYKAMQEQHNDSLLTFGFYQDFLALSLDVEARRVHRIKTLASNMPDYKQLYDSIKYNHIISPKAKTVLLYKVMEDVVKQSSIEETQEYLEKFKKDADDTVLATALADKFSINSKSGSKLDLKNAANQLYTFDQVLIENKGEFIYVDFWASWCAPCIRSFPALEKLRTIFKNEDVVFVLISKDENEKEWEKALMKYNLEGLPNCYVVQNQYTSTLLKELDINSIPRYLLYDQKGNLVHKNAPGPGSVALHELLLNYLKEGNSQNDVSAM